MNSRDLDDLLAKTSLSEDLVQLQSAIEERNRTLHVYNLINLKKNNSLRSRTVTTLQTGLTEIVDAFRFTQLSHEIVNMAKNWLAECPFEIKKFLKETNVDVNEIVAGLKGDLLPKEIVESAYKEKESIQKFYLDNVLKPFLNFCYAKVEMEEENLRLSKIYYAEVLRSYIYKKLKDTDITNKASAASASSASDQFDQSNKAHQSLNRLPDASVQRRLLNALTDNQLTGDQSRKAFIEQQLQHAKQLMEGNPSSSLQKVLSHLIEILSEKSSDFEIRKALSGVAIVQNEELLQLQEKKMHANQADYAKNYYEGIPVNERPEYYLDKLMNIVYMLMLPNTSSNGELRVLSELERTSPSLNNAPLIMLDSSSKGQLPKFKKATPQEYLEPLLKCIKNKGILTTKFVGKGQIDRVKEIIAILQDAKNHGDLITRMQAFRDDLVRKDFYKLLPDPQGQQHGENLNPILYQRYQEAMDESRNQALLKSYPQVEESSLTGMTDLINSAPRLTDIERASLQSLIANIQTPKLTDEIEKEIHQMKLSIAGTEGVDELVQLFQIQDGASNAALLLRQTVKPCIEHMHTWSTELKEHKRLQEEIAPHQALYTQLMDEVTPRRQTLIHPDERKEDAAQPHEKSNADLKRVKMCVHKCEQSIASIDHYLCVLFKHQVLLAARRFFLQSKHADSQKADKVKEAGVVFQFVRDICDEKVSTFSQANERYKKFYEQYVAMNHSLSTNSFDTYLTQQLHNEIAETKGLLHMKPTDYMAAAKDIAEKSILIYKTFPNIAELKRDFRINMNHEVFVRGIIPERIGEVQVEPGSNKMSVSKRDSKKNREKIFQETQRKLNDIEETLTNGYQKIKQATYYDGSSVSSSSPAIGVQASAAASGAISPRHDSK